MISLNKVLQSQLINHFGALENVPRDLLSLLNTINRSYNEFDEKLQMPEPELELSYSDNAALKIGHTRASEDYNKVVFEKLRESLSILKEEDQPAWELKPNGRHLSDIADLLKQETEKRVLAEEQIKNSEYKFRTLINNSSDAIFILTAVGVITYSSPSITEVLGYSENEILDLNVFSIMYDDHIAYMKSVLARPVIHGKPEKGFIGKLKHKDGSWQVCEAVVTHMLHDPLIDGIVVNFKNITERISSDKKIKRANRVYSLMSQINHTILHTPNEKDLLAKAGQIITAAGNFTLAWVDLYDDNDQNIVISQGSGVSGNEKEFINACSNELNSPQFRVLRTGKSFICNNLEKEFPSPAFQQYCADARLSSCMILPVKKMGQVIGFINLYARRKDFFDEQEVYMLETVTEEISFALDVFEKEALRAQIGKKLQFSELGLKQAQSIAHFGSWEIDLSTGAALWSDEACRIHGLTPDENTQSSESWPAFIHPEDRPSFMKVLTGSVESPAGNVAFYHRICRPDGNVRYAYTQAKYELDAEGTPVRTYGVTHDVTEMKEVQNALLHSQSNLRLLIDLIPQAIYARDANGKFVFVNKNYATLFGFDKDQILNKRLDEIIPAGNDIAELIQQDLEVMESGETLIVPDAPFSDHTGSVRQYYSIKVPFLIANEEKAVLGISLDITEQLKVDAERKKIVTDIMQRNNALEQFSYIISHNLRAPIANILGIKNALQYSENTETEKQYFTDSLFTAVDKLDTVIKDINHILQVKHQVIEKKEIVQFADIIHDIKESISNLLNTHEVEIICDLEATEILTLKSYLYSIFFNLISNSIKYSQPNTKPVIHISSRQGKDHIELIFQDNGLGIDVEKHREKLFGLYKRFHNHTEGKGMGLYMVKTQVETLGGRISITSKVNAGTKFKIEFEIQAPH